MNLCFFAVVDIEGVGVIELLQDGDELEVGVGDRVGVGVTETQAVVVVEIFGVGVSDGVMEIDGVGDVEADSDKLGVGLHERVTETLEDTNADGVAE